MVTRLTLLFCCVGGALAYTSAPVHRPQFATGMRMVGATPLVATAPRRRVGTRGQVSMGKASARVPAHGCVCSLFSHTRVGARATHSKPSSACSPRPCWRGASSSATKGWRSCAARAFRTTRALTEFCKFVGAPVKMKGNLIRRRKPTATCSGSSCDRVRAQGPPGAVGESFLVPGHALRLRGPRT